MPRPLFERRALFWLIAFDLAWTLPELVTGLGALLLTPACFLGTAIPVYRIQRGAGDRPAPAAAKALVCGIAAAVPFPVTGTTFGAALLAYMGKPAP